MDDLLNIGDKKDVTSSKNIFQLNKKSGETVLFDESKLGRSIVAALRSAGIDDNPISNQLVDEVVKKLGEELNYRDGVSTLDIREAVEIAFLERGLTEAAQKYHDHDGGDSQNEEFIIEEESEELKIEMEEKEELPVEEIKEEVNEINNDERELLEVEESIEPPEIDDSLPDDFIENMEDVEEASPQVNKSSTLPEDRQSITHKFSLENISGYLILSMYDSGEPGEIIIHITKGELSEDDQKLLNIFTNLISLSWQYNVPTSKMFADFHNQQLSMNLENQSSEPVLKIIKYLISWLTKNFI